MQGQCGLVEQSEKIQPQAVGAASWCPASGASDTGGDLALAVAEGQVRITLPGRLGRVVAALKVSVSRVAVGDLAHGASWQ